MKQGMKIIVSLILIISPIFFSSSSSLEKDLTAFRRTKDIGGINLRMQEKTLGNLEYLYKEGRIDEDTYSRLTDLVSGENIVNVDNLIQEMQSRECPVSVLSFVWLGGSATQSSPTAPFYSNTSKALTFEKAGDKTKALEYYRKAIQNYIELSDQEINYEIEAYVALAYAKIGDVSEGEKHIEVAFLKTKSDTLKAKHDYTYDGWKITEICNFTYESDSKELAEKVVNLVVEKFDYIYYGREDEILVKVFGLINKYGLEEIRNKATSLIDILPFLNASRKAYLLELANGELVTTELEETLRPAVQREIAEEAKFFVIKPVGYGFSSMGIALGGLEYLYRQLKAEGFPTLSRLALDAAAEKAVFVLTLLNEKPELFGKKNAKDIFSVASYILTCTIAEYIKDSPGKAFSNLNALFKLGDIGEVSELVRMISSGRP